MTPIVEGLPVSVQVRLARHARAIGADILSPNLTEAEMALPKPLVTRSDAVMSGTMAFAGTRVPVQALLDYLEEGDTLDKALAGRGRGT